MRRLLDSRARDKESERRLREQIAPGSYQRFVPEVGTKLAVQFPGEVIRCPVRKIISPDSVLVFVDSVPMAKSHSFDFEKMYGARRRYRDGKDIWVVQKDEDFLAEQAKILEEDAVSEKRPVSVKKGVKG